MLRVPLNQAYLSRTIRPLYGWTQATPKACFLAAAHDPAVVPLYPGMCMMRAGGDTVDVINATGVPYGLSAMFSGGYGIDECAEQGVNAFSVWVLGPDAEFEVLAPAFDPDVTWTDPTDGTTTLVHAYESGALRGVLCPAGAALDTTRPVARLIKVVSDQKIVIGGLAGSLS